MSDRAIPCHLASSSQEYERLGIKKNQVALWEDGFRTDGGKGTYEWWYFDAHLNDGSKLVIVFLTKEIAEADKPLTPTVAFTLDRPDGTHIEKHDYPPADAFSASKERCNVRIGPNVFLGDLRAYQIHVEIGDVVADLTLAATLPAWRPETGYLYFGAQAEHYFAWLPAAPQGDVEATITVAGICEHFTGIGYHDHNWGNMSMVKLMNNWYWARGTVGDYTLIASFITAEKRYDYQTFPVFMLAHKGHVIADNGSKVRFSTADFLTDKETGKPVANVTVYDYRDGSQRYVVTFRRKKTILRVKLIDTIHGIRAFLGWLIGFDGAFLRFTGDLTLDRCDGDRVVESQHDEAIWELMYFGHVRKA